MLPMIAAAIVVLSIIDRFRKEGGLRVKKRPDLKHNFHFVSQGPGLIGD